jgi:uncharacterized protein YegP (UPF0339 family)
MNSFLGKDRTAVMALRTKQKRVERRPIPGIAGIRASSVPSICARTSSRSLSLESSTPYAAISTTTTSQGDNTCRDTSATRPGCPPQRKGLKMTYWLYRDVEGYWHWRLLASNNRNIANLGGGYANKADCLHAIHLMSSSSNTPVFAK